MKIQSIFSFCFMLFFIAAQAQDEPGVSTTIEFDNTEFDFGEIESGEIVEHTYVFTNTGNRPLVVTSAKGSCGCTVPKWPKEPIMPGKTGKIEVRFDSKNKKGIQSKRVTLNTNAGTTYLTIRGKLTVSEKEESSLVPPPPPPSITKEEEKVLDTKDCFAIYPNPTTDILKLDLKEQMGKKVTVSIYDYSGKIMEQKTLEEVSQATVDFEVRDYPKGQYIASIEVEGQKPAAKCFVVGK